ncbi:MAG: hypothetical protein HFJ17_06340 [Clostridia bacterium]|nr:hypothetical protein [Clostridia bacterium]
MSVVTEENTGRGLRTDEEFFQFVDEVIQRNERSGNKETTIKLYKFPAPAKYRLQKKYPHLDIKYESFCIYRLVW